MHGPLFWLTQRSDHPEQMGGPPHLQYVKDRTSSFSDTPNIVLQKEVVILVKYKHYCTVGLVDWWISGLLLVVLALIHKRTMPKSFPAKKNPVNGMCLCGQVIRMQCNIQQCLPSSTVVNSWSARRPVAHRYSIFCRFVLKI